MDILIKQAILLHSVADVEHYVKHLHKSNNILFSTHVSVDVYLKEKYNLECRCISSLFDLNEINDIRDRSIEIINQVLSCLECEITPTINNILDLEIRYFIPHYYYRAFHQLNSYITLVEGLKKLIIIHGIDKLAIYDYCFNNFLEVNTSMEKLICILSKNDAINIVIEIIINSNKPLKPGNSIIWAKIIRLFNNPRYALGKGLTQIKNYLRFFRKTKSKKSILIYDELYDLDFITDYLDEYNVFYYHNDLGHPTGKRVKTIIIKIENATDINYTPKENDNLYGLIMNEIIMDFCKNSQRYLEPICLLKEITQKFPICIGVWGLPPVSGSKAMIFEYLRSKHIKILGAQHGFGFGESLNMQFEVDFSLCDYFISYGFTDDDVKKLRPVHGNKAEILPLGSTKFTTKQKRKQINIDIFWPITNSISIMDGGMMRIPPHILLERQKKILEYLNSLHEVKIYIKPLMNSNQDNLALIEIIKRFKKIKLINLSMNEFLRKYNPRAVIIEFPSTPIYDVLNLDTEIFLMNDELLPFEKNVLNEIQKRVYYSETVDDILAQLNLFLKGTLIKKRDDTYLKHFLIKEYTKENIIKIINDIMKTQ